MSVLLRDNTAAAAEHALGTQRTVRIQTMVRGQTFDCHRTLLQRVRQSGGLHVEETTSGKVVVVFCPVSSRHMTDIEAAMKDVPGGAPVILVVMHHTHDSDYPHITRSLGSDHSWNVEDFVNVLYHETVPGLLTCPLNERAVAQLHSTLLKHSSVSPAAASAYGGSSTGKTKGGGGLFAGMFGSEPRCAPFERQVCGRTDDHGQAQHTVRIQTKVSGQTFDGHRTLLQRVKQMGGLHLEETTSGKVIVVFCPVSSRHMTDIEAAMKDVPGGAPVILVVMHHTHDSDYPNITRSLGSDHSWNVEDFVNVLYHETAPGLLTCPLNERAVAQLHSALLKHSSVSPAAVSASAYGGSSNGKTEGGGGGLFAGFFGSEPRCAPVERQVYGRTDDHGQAQRTVRIQTMVRGQTFDCHRTLLQRVRQVGGLHLEETTSGKVVVVFCPVSSRNMADIEAAMKDVPGGAPVILVVMHHTHDGDYPHITRSLGSDHSWNVEDFVNVLYHETVPGLLTCPLNERAVAQLHSALLKHSSVSLDAASVRVNGGSSIVGPTAASVNADSSSVSPAAASVRESNRPGWMARGINYLKSKFGSDPASR